MLDTDLTKTIIQMFWENVWTGKVWGGGKRKLIFFFYSRELTDNISTTEKSRRNISMSFRAM